MALVEVGESITLNPRPGFVVKTRILESVGNTLVGSKVFINICHDSQVPRPPVDFEPAVVFPLIIDNKWEVPLIVSKEKSTTDKKGVVSKLYDCCINSTCFQWCQVNSDLRTILIEWCIEAVEILYEITLEREYSIPKMLCKGELSKTVIRKDELSETGFQKRLQELKNNETLGLIEEINGSSTDHIDTDEILPDLMNVNGEHRKPLIEELNDMKITEQSQNKPQLKTQKTTEEPELPASTKTKVNYEISFTKLSSEHQLLVKCVSTQIQLISLSYLSSKHSLVLSLTNQDYYFQDKIPHELLVPLPETITLRTAADVRTFRIGSENALFIFC